MPQGLLQQRCAPRPRGCCGPKPPPGRPPSLGDQALHSPTAPSKHAEEQGHRGFSAKHATGRYQLTVMRGSRRGPTPGEHRPEQWVSGRENVLGRVRGRWQYRLGLGAERKGKRGAPCCSVSLPGALLPRLFRGLCDP